MMNSFEIYQFVSTIKEVFGSCKILDNFEFEDLSVIYEFAQVVENYEKMKNIEKKCS